MDASVDIGVLTAKPEEWEPLVRLLIDGLPTSSGTVIAEVPNKFGGSLVVAVPPPTGAGSEAESAAHDLIQNHQPQWIGAVGMCGAVPDADWTLGDVVLATSVYDFRNYKTYPQGERRYSNSGGPMADPIKRLGDNLGGVLKSSMAGWNAKHGLAKHPPVSFAKRKFIPPPEWQEKTRKALKSHFGANGQWDGPKLLKGPFFCDSGMHRDPEYIRGWLRSAADMVGIEMELGGILKASRPKGCAEYPVLCLKAISDIVGYERDPDWIRFACQSAASCFVALLKIIPRDFIVPRSLRPQDHPALNPGAIAVAPESIASRALGGAAGIDGGAFEVAPDAAPNASETLPAGNKVSTFLYRRWPRAVRLDVPRAVPVKPGDEFRKDLPLIELGPVVLDEAALILPLGDVARSDSISWTFAGEWEPHPFWEDVRRVAGNTREPGPDDRERGKHVRLASAGSARETGGANFVWQKISWQQSVDTNHSVNEVQYGGVPVKCWFAERDLILPPLDSDTERHDPPLANRLAVNLAVILKTPDKGNWVVFQYRPPNKTDFAHRLEPGASESVHGDRVWQPHERDIVDGHPDVFRTAERCLWQELGVAVHGSTPGSLPGFELDLHFFAVILNKSELSPRLVGCAILEGGLDDFKRSIVESGKGMIEHREFLTRRVGDAAEWEHIHLAEANPKALAGVLKSSRATSRHVLGPEGRARLIYYLKHEFPDCASAELTKYYSRAPPDWVRRYQ